MRQTPEGIYVSRMSQKGLRINLIGYAQSNARVSTLMRNIEASPWLEAPKLNEIKAVTLAQLNETYALVRGGPNLFRVKKGNYIGQNFGVITSIDETEIKLKELVQDGGGDWVERASSLQLQEAQR